MRRRLRWALIIERSLITVMWFTGIGLLLIAVDWFVGLPAIFRTVDFILGVTGLLAVVHYEIVPATQFSPRLVDVALRVERVVPMLRSRLAAALEYELEREESPLARAIQEEVTDSTTAITKAPVVNTAPMRRAAWRALLVCGLAAVPWTLDSQWTDIATRRLLQPWKNVRWPATTEVQSLVEVTHAARGMPLRLGARLVRGDPTSTDIEITWRLTEADGRQATRSAIVPRQPSGDYEYLLEPGTADRVEWSFRTLDAESTEQLVRFIDPPAVRRVEIHAEPPTYAASVLKESAIVVDIPADADATTVHLDPVVEGSRVSVKVVLEPAPPCPSAAPATPAFEEWAARQWHFSDAAEGTANEPAARCSGDEWSFEWEALGNSTIDLTPTDQRGLSSRASVRVGVDAIPDERPTLDLLAPSADERVVADARVRVAAEMADDVALAWGAAEVDRIRVGEGQSQALSARDEFTGTAAPFETTIDLAALAGGCVAGDQLEVKASVQDVAGEVLGRAPVASVVRRLRVVSRAQFEQDVGVSAQAIRSRAVRADERQAEVGRMSASDRRALSQQVEVADRITATREASDALLDRLERNGLGDQSLAQSLREAVSALDEAGERAGEAREAMQRASEAAEQSDASAEEQASHAAREAQRDVREALASVARLLEREDDSWSLRRDMERVAERLDAAQEARESMSDASSGAAPESLDAKDRAAMDRAASETEQAAEQARDLLDEMRRRADSLRESQPERGEAMRRAAERAERAGLTESLDQSATATRANQQEQASQSASAAREALAQMEEAMDAEEQLRLEALKRKLATLVESLEGLVAANESVAQEVSSERPASAVANEVIALHRNTGAVQDQAGALGPDGVGMVRSIARAAEHQATAASALRGAEPERASAAEALARATPMLREALDAARAREKQAQQQAEQKQQDALRAKYLAILPLQDDVLRGISAAREAGLSGRRLLIEGKRLASLQTKADADLEVVSADPMVQSSTAFREAHRLAHEAAMSSGAALAGGTVDDHAEAAAQAFRDVVASLVEALSQEATRRDRFGRNQMAGGANAGGGGGSPPEGEMPPAAELKVLKGLQGQIQRRTRAIAEGAPARTGEVADLAARQRAVANLVSEIAAKLQESSEGGRPTPGADRGETHPNPSGFGLHSCSEDGDL